MSEHDETAADVADDATQAGSARPVVVAMALRAFWWAAHHVVARPLALAIPVRGLFRFSAWTYGRRNMRG